MSVQQYSVNQHPIQALLTFIKTGEIAIPEIQRPFVWDATKVRDLIDSLYEGYPIGYLIAWINPSVKLKDGTSSKGKRILIDGQQRVTALMAALLGARVINKDYKRVNIVIAFNPREKKFEVSNPAIKKDKAWIANIAEILSPNVKMLKLVSNYCEVNEGSNQDDIFESIELLRGIVNNHIGFIELNSDLDIETVTEIFIRINSQGAVLSQADFAMSKIAANETYNGNKLRKGIIKSIITKSHSFGKFVMPLLSDLSLRTTYRSNGNSLATDFYLPCYERSILYRRAVGYFTSSGMAVVAKGIAKFITTGGKEKYN